MGELPSDVKYRLSNDLDLPDHDIKVYLQERHLFDFFEAARKSLTSGEPKEMSKWIVGDLNALLKESNDQVVSIQPNTFSKLIDDNKSGKVSSKMIKEIIPILLKGTPLDEAISSLGGAQISNQDELLEIVKKVLSQNPDVVEKIQNGKVASANFLMGQVMKETKGRAKPDTVREMILNACQSD